MKRKLDKTGEPSAAPAEPKPETKPSQPETQPAEPSFAELGLDPRLVQAVAKQSFEKPTLVQRKAIPLALQGQDILCKAKTGSGKTAAYVLPVLSSILKRKAVRAPSRFPLTQIAVALSPSRTFPIAPMLTPRPRPTRRPSPPP